MSKETLISTQKHTPFTINEGVEKKGGVNKCPTTPRPPPPLGQDGKKKETMNEQRVLKILGKSIKTGTTDILNNSFGKYQAYIYWDNQEAKITLDGDFFIEQLEALIWWMKNKKEKTNE